MNKSSKLLVLIVTVFLLVNSIQVECRRTYSTSSGRRTSSGRGNRGKNQPSSSSGVFSSWFGGSKSSGTSSGSVKPASSTASKNWQTAASHTASQPKSGWANPYYKPTSGSAVPSAPKEANYGWKPVGTNSKAGPPYPSSNIGSRGYPVQSGVQQGSQSNLGGFKPAPSVPNVHSTNYQPSHSSFGGSSVPNTHNTNYQPSQSNFGGYRPSANAPNSFNTYNQPPSIHSNPSQQSSFGGYHTAPSNLNTGYKPSNTYQPSHGAPSYNAAPSYGAAPSYHPSSGHHASAYPQQTGYSGHYPSQTYSGYPVHNTFGSSAPSYQGNKLFGGSSGHYGYPTSGSWGIDTYGAKKSSSGTGKLLTGLAVGAAGGYLTSSLVNRISNPWKYSGYGYGSGYGYSGLGSGLGLGLGSGYGYSSIRDESAFERGYERGARDRNENKNNTPAPPPAPEPEDPTSKWIQCVAFDPQTQQTLINPNCSCTVTTSLDERTGQPLSVHHCTTLNGLVMKPFPIQSNQGINSPSLSADNFGGQPPVGVNAPGAVPSYGDAYQGGSQYGAGPGVYLPFPSEVKNDQSSIKSEESQTVATSAKEIAEKKPEESTIKMEGATSTDKISEIITAQNASLIESMTNGTMGESKTESQNLEKNQEPNKELEGKMQGTLEDSRDVAQFYGQLQKIVNMGNFVDRA